MLKKLTNYFIITVLLFSLSFLIVSADHYSGQQLVGSCKNPSGGNYCGGKSSFSVDANCFCDKASEDYHDYCSDYFEICSPNVNIPPQPNAEPLQPVPKPEITGVQGYDANTGEYTTDLFPNKYVILYGNFPGADQFNPIYSVHINGYNLSPDYEIYSQINAKVGTIKTGFYPIWVSNSQGLQSDILNVFVNHTSVYDPACVNYCEYVNQTRCVNNYQYKCILNNANCLDWDWSSGKNCISGCDEFGKKCKEDKIIVVVENVTCVFSYSKTEQKCYSTEPVGPKAKIVSCSGIGNCIVEVKGKYGEKINWKSSCGGYVTTIIDGTNKYIEFDCSQKNSSCVDTDNGKNEFVAGKTYIDSSDPYVYYDQCSSNSVVEYYCSHDSASNQEFIKKDLIQCKIGCKDGACLKEPQVKSMAYIKKQYIVGQPFTLTATAESPYSQIVSAKWDMSSSCKPTSGSYFSKIGIEGFKYYTEINVVCNNIEPVKFTVNFKDEKGLILSDTIYIYINSDSSQSGSVTKQPAMPQEEEFVTPSISTSGNLIANTGSCKDSCGSKSQSPDSQCYCDDYSVTSAGDFCNDIAVHCPNIWNNPANKYKSS